MDPPKVDSTISSPLISVSNHPKFWLDGSTYAGCYIDQWSSCIRPLHIGLRNVTMLIPFLQNSEDRSSSTNVQPATAAPSQNAGNIALPSTKTTSYHQSSLSIEVGPTEPTPSDETHSERLVRPGQDENLECPSCRRQFRISEHHLLLKHFNACQNRQMTSWWPLSLSLYHLKN